MIPAWVKWLAAAAAALALLAIAGRMVGSYNEARRVEGDQRTEARLAERDRRQAATALNHAHDNARETLRRLQQQKENEDAATRDRHRAAADAARARDAAGQLREHVAALESVATAAVTDCRDTAAAREREAAASAARMLAELQRRADERAGILAEYADRARIAGQQCERDYDALTLRPAAELAAPP